MRPQYQSGRTVALGFESNTSDATNLEMGGRLRNLF
jgi:hypothetical protein